jgi:hypothetical protein
MQGGQDHVAREAGLDGGGGRLRIADLACHLVLDRILHCHDVHSPATSTGPSQVLFTRLSPRSAWTVLALR